MNPFKRDPSAWMILAGNLFPIFGVAFLGWDAFMVIWVYVLETIVIGLYNIIKMMTVNVDVLGKGHERLTKSPPPALRIFVVLFFTVHYGVFVAVQMFFIRKLFGINDQQILHHFNLGNYLNPYDNPEIYLATLGMVLSHGGSYIYNYLVRGENMKQEIMQTMFSPYRRIVIQQFVAIFGGGLVIRLGGSVGIVLFFILLKIGADIYSHHRSHKKKIAQHA